MEWLTKQEEAIVQAARIPVDSWKPMTYWIVSLSNESLMPTELELRQLRNFTEFKVKSWYNETYQHKLLVEQPLAKDGGHNTITFMKGWRGAGDKEFAAQAAAGWHFRRFTWEYGPHFVPAKYGTNEPYVPLTLTQCFDRCERYSATEPRPAWEAWKKQYPELYANESPAALPPPPAKKPKASKRKTASKRKAAR